METVGVDQTNLDRGAGLARFAEYERSGAARGVRSTAKIKGDVPEENQRAGEKVWKRIWGGWG